MLGRKLKMAIEPPALDQHGEETSPTTELGKLDLPCKKEAVANMHQQKLNGDMNGDGEEGEEEEGKEEDGKDNNEKEKWIYGTPGTEDYKPDLTDDEIEHSKRALGETTPYKDKLHSNRVSKVLESYLF